MRHWRKAEMSWMYVQEPASNKKRLCHYIANCDTMTSPRNKLVVKDVSYTDVKN